MGWRGRAKGERDPAPGQIGFCYYFHPMGGIIKIHQNEKKNICNERPQKLPHRSILKWVGYCRIKRCMQLFKISRESKNQKSTKKLLKKTTNLSIIYGLSYDIGMQSLLVRKKPLKRERSWSAPVLKWSDFEKLDGFWKLSVLATFPAKKNFKKEYFSQKYFGSHQWRKMAEPWLPNKNRLKGP